MYACISPFYNYFTIFLRVFIISYPHPETKGICSNYFDRVLSSHKRENLSDARSQMTFKSVVFFRETPVVQTCLEKKFNLVT